MPPNSETLPVPYVPVRITRCAFVAHRYAFMGELTRLLAAEPLSTAGFLFHSHAVSMWNE